MLNVKHDDENGTITSDLRKPDLPPSSRQSARLALRNPTDPIRDSDPSRRFRVFNRSVRSLSDPNDFSVPLPVRPITTASEDIPSGE